MSYSTTLYAIDIATLKAAIGSGDSSLLERLRHVNTSRDQNSPVKESMAEDLSGDFALRATLAGELLFEGRPIAAEDLSNVIRAIAGGCLELILEAPWSAAHAIAITVVQQEAPHSALEQILTRFVTNDPVLAKNLDQSPRVLWTRSGAALSTERSTFHPGFSASDEALCDLLNGNLNNSGSELGYALEVFCFVLGEILPDEDLIGDLAPLKLKSPLQKSRPPVPLKRYRDFPVVSHLTAEEVTLETQRLSQIDLAFPRDEDIAEARQAFARCVQTAAELQRGIVSFYY